MKTYRIDGSADFKQANLSNWKENTAFWLTAKLRHVGHILPIARDIINREAAKSGPTFSVVDVGCGDAWLARMMRDQLIGGKYIGLDFNPVLIESLLSKSSDDNLVSFQQVDIEQTLPVELVGKADLVVNAFNFFELTDLPTAFTNHIEMLKQDGSLLIFHIDPFSQLLTVVTDLNELREELSAFEKDGSHLGYDKLIDLQDGQAAQVYKGILYKFSEYHKLARQHGFELEDFEELLYVRQGRPQLYQVGLWRRRGH